MFWKYLNTFINLILKNMANKILCPFCSEEIDSKSEICPICAEIIKDDSSYKPKEEFIVKNEFDKEESNIIKEEIVSKKLTINKRIVNQFKNHLEFLWYDIEELEWTKELENAFILCKSEKRSNVTINVLNENNILGSSRYMIGKIESDNQLLNIYETLNKINTQSFISKWSYSLDTDWESIVTIEIFIMKYDKFDFWKQIELMEEEIKNNIGLFLDIKE